MIPTEASRPTVVVATTAAGGMSTGGALAITFLVLKLCHVITWSWLWVLAPFWIPAALVVLLILGFVAAFIVAGVVDTREREQQKRERAGGIQPAQHGPAVRWPR